MAFSKIKLPFKRASKDKVVVEAVPFQGGIGSITEGGPPTFMMGTYYLIIAMFVSAIILATIAKTDSVVVGSGRLTTERPPIQLQPVDRAIIRELKVKSGDVVKKGQVLATFDPTFARADLVSLLAQQKSLSAQIRRLESELNNTVFKIDSHSNAEEKLQSALMLQRQAQYKSRLRMFDEEIKRIQASIRTTEDERVPLAKLLEISKDVEAKRRVLANSGTGTNLQYQDSQVASIRTEKDLRGAANRLLEMQHSLLFKKAERQTFVDDWLRQVMDKLVVTRNEVAKINELVVKAERINDFEELTAPVDGVVLDVGKRTAGAVLPGAEVLITIVPSNATLVAEVMIPSGDIGYIKPGDKVVIKINAFPYQRHGMLEGRLRFVSQESFHSGGDSEADGQGGGGVGAVHTGRVELMRTELENLPEGIHLIRGMTLIAEIKVGSRSVASYILYPILRSFGESMREP